MRIAESLLFLALQAAGGTLFGYAVGTVGTRGRPTPQRIWGTLGTLPRGRFAAYFGTLGLAWFIAVWLMWFWRAEWHAVLIASALTAIVVVLVAGWIIAILCARTRQR